MMTSSPTPPSPCLPLSARCLTDEQRSAVATWFSIYRGVEGDRAKLAVTANMHPAVDRAYNMLLDVFTTVRQ